MYERLEQKIWLELYNRSGIVVTIPVDHSLQHEKNTFKEFDFERKISLWVEFRNK